MRPKLLRNAALAALLFGCASTQTLSAEYALDPREHPEGIECFYSCLKQSDEQERRWCLSLCDGVEVVLTEQPCAPGSPALCRGYVLREHELTDAAETGTAQAADEDGSIVAEVIGAIFGALIEGALCSGDCDDSDDDDSYDTTDYQHHQPRAERTRTLREPPPPRTERAAKPSSDRRGRPRK